MRAPKRAATVHPQTRATSPPRIRRRPAELDTPRTRCAFAVVGACLGSSARAPEPSSSFRFTVLAARFAGLTTGFFSSTGRQTINSFPRCCTGAARARRRFAQHRLALGTILENTRTLTSPCALSATSISCITCAVNPCWPMLTTGCSACAFARSSRRCFEVSSIMRECSCGASPAPASSLMSAARSKGRRIVEWLLVVAALVVGIPAAAWLSQERLIFFPQPLTDTTHLPAHAKPLEVVAADGTRLAGFEISGSRTTCAGAAVFRRQRRRDLLDARRRTLAARVDDRGTELPWLRAQRRQARRAGAGRGRPRAVRRDRPRDQASIRAASSWSAEASEPAWRRASPPSGRWPAPC